MSNLILPLPNGIEWNVVKRANWSTLVQRSASGREVRSPLYANPIWNFEMSWSRLPDFAPSAFLNDSPPVAPVLSSSAANALPAATYYVVTTYLFPDGESNSSPESSTAITANHCLEVAAPSNPGGGCYGWNVYVGMWSGGEVLQNETPLPFGSPWIEDELGLTANLNSPNHVAGLAGSQCNVVPPAAESSGPGSLSPDDTIWQTLLGFYNARQGSFDDFLYSDPTDGYLFNQIGTGDGVTTTFQLSRTYGGFTEPIYNPLGPAILFVGSSQVNTGFTVSGTGLVTFSSAPVLNADIFAYCGFFFRCRFTDDNLEGNNFLYNLFELKKLSLTSVKP